MKVTAKIKRNISQVTARIEGNAPVSVALSKKKIEHFRSLSPLNVTVNLQGGNDKHYEHRQDSALAVWDITHNLDKIPSVSVFDSAGDKWEVIPNFVSSNRLTITFPAALTGVAYLN